MCRGVHLLDCFLDLFICTYVTISSRITAFYCDTLGNKAYEATVKFPKNDSINLFVYSAHFVLLSLPSNSFHRTESFCPSYR
uniref:Secreted protein n=1 Tax=Rhizophora mucronata TaxID=61149 RepID=A0A2P2NU90_RHIMU